MSDDTDRIREALQFIPVGGHDERFRLGCMLKSELGEAGRELWDKWRGDRGEDEAAAVWKSISETGALKIGSLFHEAKANGWRDDGGYQKPTPEVLAERRSIAAERAAREEAGIARERADTAAKAAAILKAATEANADHPYLTRKRVTPVATLREIDASAAVAILGYHPKSGGDLLTGRLLVVPVEQGDGISTLELIDGDKRKAALAGRGSKVGGYWATARLPDSDGPGLILLIGEGVATVLSASTASGKLGIAALSSGNLPTVAKAMRERYPAAALVILADLMKATGEPDSHAIEAARSVGGKLAIPDFGIDRDPDMTDFNDMAVAHGLEAVGNEIVSAVVLPGDEQQSGCWDSSQTDEAEEGDGKNKSQASLIVKYAQEHAELFHDPNRDVYAKDKSSGEVRRIDGRQFRDWLVANFYEIHDVAPRDQSIREALSTLSGLGRFRGECRDVHIRVAATDDCYFLDLAEPGNNSTVCISPGRWEVVSDAPVEFVRSESMQSLPRPVGRGNFDTLWRIANIPKESRLLVLTWLCECLRPETPFPVLELIGEQGSAKSTTQAALRRLIDPNACDLRGAPKGPEDIFVGAGVSWIVSYENISHLSSQMQDALCILATGGGFAKRKLYTDADESVINVKRPTVLNGISASITAQDLIDRTISVETPVITDRIETISLWREFDSQRGYLLGALLDLMSGALMVLPSIELPRADRPRLAEFARLGMAVAKAQGLDSNEFMMQFNFSRAESIARTIDASPVATAIIDWFEGRHHQAIEMSVKSLFATIEQYRPIGSDAWPKTAKGFGDAMRRAAPALRTFGIECRSLGKVGGYVHWEIRPRKDFVDTSPECPQVLGS